MTPVAGVLLAGGLARRMGGGDKCLRQLAGETLLARVIARAAPQVGPLILNANGDPARFAPYDLPVVADVVEGYAGPLAGILTALEWAAENAPHHPLVASFATDAPFLPRDLVQTMVEARDLAGADLACAASGGRAHPVFGLWPVELRAGLARGPGGAGRTQDRPLDREPQAGGSRLPLCSRGPVLQRQPRGRSGRGRALDRAARPLTLSPAKRRNTVIPLCGRR